MEHNIFAKAGVMVCCITIIFLFSWENYWRKKGYVVSCNDDKIVWAGKRKMVYQSPENATVFLGGSRIKFDLDIDTWEKLTGEHAIQLAMVGTPARLILLDLANDKKFRGKVLVDVAEGQMFSADTIRRDKSAKEALKYYYSETPAQKASAAINNVLESKLVFLEESKLGLNNLLNELRLQNRAGVPPGGLPVPKEYSYASFSRQAIFSSRFLADTSWQHKQIATWQRFGIATMGNPPIFKGDSLTMLFAQLKTAIDKIRSRGGTVVFVRPPSSLGYLKKENEIYPRQLYWDKMLTYTGTPGIYYADYPGTRNLMCIESSHLSSSNAVTYTEQLVKILKEEKGWKFHNQITN
jgi:hypothetical protein